MAKIKAQVQEERLDPRTYYGWLLAKIFEWGSDDDSISHNLEYAKEVWMGMGGSFSKKSKRQMRHDIQQIFGEFMIDE